MAEPEQQQSAAVQAEDGEAEEDNEAADQRQEDMATFDLFSAVKDGNTDSVRRLLESKHCRSRLNDRNEWGDTVLHLSAEAGNSEVCQMLVAGGASVTVRNNRGETCLHRAAVGGHKECVRAIVERDNDPESVNAQNDAGYTSLHHAAKHGSIELIQVLLKAGADRMLENNAGETPYMVAHKYQQFEVERLLLNIDQAHAERAMQQMNTKAKKIITAYKKALKHAHKPESRVRLMLIGDAGSGKTSLKKTLFNETFDAEEIPTRGIDADPAVTRIQFRQYREWVLQPASKADAHRLNLEHTDALIDYIFTEIRKPGPSDEIVDLRRLNQRKDPKSVSFRENLSIIPDPVLSESSSVEEQSVSSQESTTETTSGISTNVNGGLDAEKEDEYGEEPSCASDFGGEGSLSLVASRLLSPTLKAKPPFPPGSSSSGDCSSTSSSSSEHSLSGLTGRNDENSFATPAFVKGALATLPEKYNGSEPFHQESNGHQAEDDSDGTAERPSQLSTEAEEDENAEGEEPEPIPMLPPLESPDKPRLTNFESTQELSKMLLDNVPIEVLKRLIMRWPVTGETNEFNSLSRQRLLISVWDCSGDPLQSNIIPLFFTPHSLFIVTHKATDDLSSPAESYLQRKLTDLSSQTPTKGEVLEEWVGGVLAHTVHAQTGPFHYCKTTPQIPPVIFVNTHGDLEGAKSFNEFFSRPSYSRLKLHLLDQVPTFVTVSNSYEGEMLDDYGSHHILRREIEHIARQMPYILDMVPVHWVKFEQLIHSLIEQKKVIVEVEDLEMYIAKQCDISGPMQVQPVLAHFHDIGVIIHFHRHPILKRFMVTSPQWLLDALASIISSSSNNWITTEVIEAFQELRNTGRIRRDILLLAYRCAKMPQRYWNETLFFMTHMNLISCHPSLHESKSVFIPAMVQRTPPAFSFGPTESDPATLYVSCGINVFPMALFNQLVTGCIRRCRYPPTLYHHIVHFRLDHSHHLLLTKEKDSVGILVQSKTEHFCNNCVPDEVSYEVEDGCRHADHIADYESDSVTAEHLLSRPEDSADLLTSSQLSLSTDVNALRDICPHVLSFVMEQLEFLHNCWYPGLKLQLRTRQGELLGQKWHHTVFNHGHAPENLAVWFH